MAETELFCQQNISIQHLSEPNLNGKEFFDVSTPSPSLITQEVSASESVSVEISRSTSFQTTVVQSSMTKFVPNIRCGSHTDIGCRRSNEDEHIQIDDLSAYLGSVNNRSTSLPSAFFAVFDGHGGSDAAAFLKSNAVRLFFQEASLPQTYHDIDDPFLEELKNSHRKAFLRADQALMADECSGVDASCGTTALTALILGRHLLIANAGDSRAVLCRKGLAVPVSQDHRPTNLQEQKRVKDLGGYIEDGYLNGELAVTRALGDWYMKLPLGSKSPLIAEPDVQHIMLTEDDEFLILACDGVWDVMSNEEAINIIRRELRQHNDPQQCAKELVNQALRKDTADNVTAMVVCFTSPDRRDSVAPDHRPRLRCCSLSEEARNRLRSLLEGN